MWKPIDAAPKDGSEIVCCWAGKELIVLLRWKTNHRIERSHKVGEDMAGLYAESYFGDLEEWDDYELALAENAPTHWHPLDPIPPAAE